MDESQSEADLRSYASFEGKGTRSIEAWFLGPRGENSDVLERLVVEALRDQVYWRRNFHPEDPEHITGAIRRSPDYVEAMEGLEQGFRGLLAFLKKSVPFFSMRYQGHMNWETTLPSIAGYFAGLLYNPNNVAFEGSSATTILELLVGDDLCRMLGYRVPRLDGLGPSDTDTHAPAPWGHVTCDGTVANIEAVWAARNLRYYAPALRSALRSDERLAKARGVKVTVGGKDVALVEADVWQSLNLQVDEILALPNQVARALGGDEKAGLALVSEVVGARTIQTLGFQGFATEVLEGAPPGVVLVPGTRHYSFPKAAAVLGLGARNLIDVPVDLDARLDLAELRHHLDRCLRERRPVLAVVAVIGSTEESAVDPLEGVLQVRDEYRRKGLDFAVHADAAWGGYHASVIRDDFDMPQPGFGFAGGPPPAITLSAFVAKQFRALGSADSITVDPHKSGYIPYPAGALCYRNSAMRSLVTFSAPVVFHGEAEPTVGIYGIEGSKPGAAVAAVYLSHRVIRPSKSGYGRIIGRALYTCKKMYVRLLAMRQAGKDPFYPVPVPRLPSSVKGHDELAQAGAIVAALDGVPNDVISADQRLLDLCAEIGPDQNILAYAFNFRRADGQANTSLAAANRLNMAMYRQLSLKPLADIYDQDLIVSTTDLGKDAYGQAFFDAYTARLGITVPDAPHVTVLRSVTMDPWVTETANGLDFIDVIERALRRAAAAAWKEVADDRGAI